MLGHGPQRRRLLHRPPAGRRRPLLRLPGAGDRSPARLVGRGHRRLGPAVARAHRARRLPRADLSRRGQADPDLALGAAVPLAGHARAPRASCCTPRPSISRATSTTASSTPTTTSSRRCCATATSPPGRRRWPRRPAWSRAGALRVALVAVLRRHAGRRRPGAPDAERGQHGRRLAALHRDDERGVADRVGVGRAAPATLTVTASPAGLAPGTYNADGDGRRRRGRRLSAQRAGHAHVAAAPPSAASAADRPARHRDASSPTATGSAPAPPRPSGRSATATGSMAKLNVYLDSGQPRHPARGGRLRQQPTATPGGC